MSEHAWLQQAACKDEPLDLFFPKKGDGDNGRRAKKICATCPVQDECLADALRYGDREGIRAGLNVKQRRKLYPRPPRVAQCGTDSGYYRHRDRGEDACVDCKQAHAAKQREMVKIKPPRPSERMLSRTVVAGRYQAL